MDSALSAAFARFQSGDVIPPHDPAFAAVMPIVAETLRRIATLNANGDISEVRAILGTIFGQAIDESTTVFPPFTTNFGRFTTVGKQVFINHGCSFLDLGGITIEDHVLIGPQVKLVTENHPIDPASRKGLVTAPIVIRRNAWIGAGATILPGVTIGENSIVAAGAVVRKSVPDNVVVGGVPAVVLRTIASDLE